MKKTISINFRMTKDIHEWLRKEAYEKNVSINSLILKALEAAKETESKTAVSAEK